MTTIIEEQDPFAKALAIYQQQLNKKEKPTYTYVSNNNREEIPWYGLEYGQETVIRILGIPPEVREENWHPKIIYYSELVTDTKKRYTDIIWKTNNNNSIDNEWVLKKLIDRVYKKDWENIPFIDSKGKSQKGRYVYHYSDTVIYDLLDKNDLSLDKDVRLYPKKAKPSKRVLLPVLVRNEGSSSIKILTTKYSSKEYTDKQGNKKSQIYCDFGIPYSEDPKKKYLHDLINEKIAYKFKHWDLDIVIKKTKLTEVQIQYDIFTCYSTEVSSFSKSLVSKFPELVDDAYSEKIPLKVKLTPQEEALEKPDLDLLFKHTSYEKLHLFHKELFLLADKTFGTSFYDELVQNLKIENPSAVIPATSVTLPVTENVSSAPAPVSATTFTPVATPVPRRSAITDAGVSLIDQCKSIFKSWESLSDKEKNILVSSIDSFDDGIPKFKSEQKNNILTCNCEQKFTKLSDGSSSTINVSCHNDIQTCPMCAKTLI